MNGYLRLPEKHKSGRTPRMYHLVLSLDKTDPPCPPRFMGRLVLRGFVTPSRSALDGSGDMPHVRLASLPDGAHLRPIGRVSPLGEVSVEQPSLRAVQSGLTYRITSSTDRNQVSPALAETLENVLGQFAASRGFTAQAPLPISFTRGYDKGDRGHGSGLAMDIASVGERGLRDWKQDWDRTLTQTRDLPNSDAQRSVIAKEAQRNLGYQLYRALLDRGGWRVFNHVVQLFGPWTDRLGPWHRLHYETPTDAQRQLMEEQEHIFRAHQDHIHVALGQ